MQFLTSDPLRRLGSTLALSLILCGPALADQTAAPVAAQSPRYDLYDDTIQAVRARHGMVASEQKLATEIGVAILRRGGNAIDAAVAVGFAQAVVLPAAGNIGGGGFMVIHEARTGRNIALDFREMAPGRASRDMYLDERGEVVPKRSTDTHLAVGVPGTVAGLIHALNKYGSLKLPEVMAPAIELARKGFVVSEHLATQLAANRDHLGRWPATKKIFFKGDRPLQAGEKLVQEDLADSLELIAQRGASAFYSGPIAEKIAAEMSRHGGLINLDDLKRYRVMEREPVTGDYRGYQIVSMPPPSSGGTHIVQLLNMLSHYPLREYGAGSAQTIHIQAEAMKLAYADRSEYLGDPDFSKVPVKGLTSPAYAAELVKQIDPAKARPSAEIKPGRPQPYEGDQTTHYSVADGQGNVASTTYTLNLNFGSGIVAAGTGILLNNEMDDFSAKPGVPNAFGLIGGDANAVAPYKRPLSSMSPTIVLKNGKPWLVTGSPGGSRIITTTLQTIIDAIDFDMNPAQAAITPRIHHQWLPDELWVERGISPDTVRLLREKGHKVVPKRSFGVTQTIRIDANGFLGYADPRSPDGVAAGY
ncbi:gamma-glutamyltransferase [Chitinimonas lacunae]|uniref:Glutathione hydrolase proenzyme n=1 Tax=Chitinimonas lacunae TaxID=1963018 RepID=A0ABV8MUJ3_9NEIS